MREHEIMKHRIPSNHTGMCVSPRFGWCTNHQPRVETSQNCPECKCKKKSHGLCCIRKWADNFDCASEQRVRPSGVQILRIFDSVCGCVCAQNMDTQKSECVCICLYFLIHRPGSKRKWSSSELQETRGRVTENKRFFSVVFLQWERINTEFFLQELHP